MRIAVIGAGVAGLGAAWALSARHDVVLYESETRLGGHANTAHVDDDGRPTPVDTGFIVYNEANYPNLTRLFRSLGVRTEPSDMSFSVSLDHGSFEYQARGLGLLARPGNLVHPAYLRMIRDIVRFARTAASHHDPTGTVRDFLERNRYSAPFRDDFLLPMVACIWSSNLETMLDYPAASMLGFLNNHGLLDIFHRPRWRTVTGGSVEYVRRIAEAPLRVRTGAPVAAVVRSSDGVRVRSPEDVDAFDHVILATHADAALGILGPEATEDERSILGSFGYQDNLAVLHRDPTLMPSSRRVWSSWNYLADSETPPSRSVSLTYWMNRLQNLETRRPVFVTLNPSAEPKDVEGRFRYRHPRFDARAIGAQRRMERIQGERRTWFCGSYHGFGFHEDALRSGLEIAARLGSPAPWWPIDEPPSTAPAKYATIGV